MSRSLTESQPDLPQAWLLLSGGIDSAACAAFYLERNYRLECLHITYGQPASQPELTAARRIADYFHVPLTALRWSAPSLLPSGEIPGRNGFLLLGALLHIGNRVGVLATGLHAETPYSDCSPTFLSSLQRVFDGYCDGRLILSAPFLAWTKSHILAYCRQAHVPLHLTYSCDRGAEPPCGVCHSCHDRGLVDAL